MVTVMLRDESTRLSPRKGNDAQFLLPFSFHGLRFLSPYPQLGQGTHFAQIL